MNREKQTFRAGVLASLCAFCLSMGCVFCPVTAFGLQVNAWALGIAGLTASIVCTLLLCVFPSSRAPDRPRRDSAQRTSLPPLRST